jgi:AraC family transcriptional regulator, transcriptional activator of the genes for pyochelin and ferripyochelin receptors
VLKLRESDFREVLLERALRGPAADDRPVCWGSRQLIVPERLGQGVLAFMDSADGVAAALGEFSPLEDTEIRILPREDASEVEIGFMLKGSIERQIGENGQRVAMGPNQLSVWARQQGQPHISRYRGGESVRFLSLQLPRACAAAFLDTESQRTRTGLAAGLPFLAGSDDQLRRVALTPELLVALHQFLSPPPLRRTPDLYLHAKALELVALGLELMDSARSQPGDRVRYAKVAPLRAQDTERIRAAAELLVSRMESPPTLRALAREVGMNEQKLKAGFREVFGMTAFAYLQQRRLTRAHELIETGELSVSQVALAVGYAHFGYFAASFRARFGVHPGMLLRGSRRRPRGS